MDLHSRVSLISKQSYGGALALTSKFGLPISIKIQSAGCGLFGDVFMTLEALRFAEKHGLTARICWGKRSLYFDKDRGTNVWLYYFSKSDFRPQEALKNSFASFPYLPIAREPTNDAGLSVRQTLNRMIERYGNINTDIMRCADEFVARDLSGAPFLGVHYRGTDARSGVEGRIQGDYRDFFEECENWLKSNAAGKIFLATDEERVLTAFKANFGDAVKARSIPRSLDGTSMHGHYDQGIASDRFSDGKNVLIDAVILSKSDLLIRTHSNVTMFSLCLNSSLDFIDIGRKKWGEVRRSWLHG